MDAEGRTVGRPSTATRLTLTVLAAACAGGAAADDLYGPFQTPHTNWGLFAGALRTDNATLAETGGVADTLETIGVTAGLYEKSGPLEASLDGSIHNEYYADRTYPDHTLGHLVADGSYALVPEQLNWTLRDTYGQVSPNPILPATPANRISANTFTTGPDADLRLGGSLDLLLGAHYGQSDFQQNPVALVSNRTVSGNLGLRERLTPTSSLSINLSDSEIVYREPGNPEYGQQEAYLRYDARSARGGVALDLGATRVDEGGSAAVDPLLRVTLFRRLTGSWNVNLTAGSQFQNSGQALQQAFAAERVVNGQVVNPNGGLGLGIPGAESADLLLSQTPYRYDSGTVTFDFVRPRTTFSLAGSAGHQHYEFGGGALDRSVAQGDLGFTRRMRRTLDFRLAGEYQRRSPAGATPGDHTTSASAGFEWHPGALLGVELSYHHTQRETDAGGFPYLENTVYLGLSYGPPAQRLAYAPLSRPASVTGSP
jgi:hypothetical protein